ncbi:MAG: SGNH/GDSL hydrolase family protein [Kiritimatiellae bacterium]|nr:SGNH/GDSL hydrolase family protein [Kiritimatiellia bacterium]MDW8457829.1 SGNH/GDSL hydrolase family protein [Verrucomicrobiota bacterium]
MKHVLFRMILLACSLAASFVLLEWAIRRFLPFYDPRRQIVFPTMPMYNDAAIGPKNERIRQRTPKGDFDLWIQFNRHGFRDTKDLSSSSPTDWFAVGDSFTFGWGIPEGGRYSDLLEKKLGWRIFNIAVPSDLDQYIGLVRYARDCGAVISNAIVGVCMNNDLKNYRTAEKQQKAIYGDRQPWKARLRVWMQSHSAVYLFCSYELQRIPAFRGLFERLGVARDIRELTLQNLYDEEILESSAEKAVELARVIGSPSTYFVLIPSLALWLADDPAMERRVHESFADRIRQRGLKVIDLKPAFEAHPNPRSLYFATDPHWNDAGHAFAADVIARALQESGPNP